MARGLDGQLLSDARELDVLIYGSCVSRDLVALHEPSLRCVDYIARQSWVSATTEGSDVHIGQLLTSKFQQKNFEGDIRSDALERVVVQLSKADALLIDLIDERFGVFPFGNGYVTPSAEFTQSGFAKEISLGEHISFGTERHLELWAAAAARVRDRIAPARKAVFVLETPFTDRSVDGSTVSPARGRDAAEWNQMYRQYFGILRDLGFMVLTLPDEFAVTSPHHIWGKAPFHYVEQSYKWLYEAISAALLRGDGLIADAASQEARGMADNR